MSFSGTFRKFAVPQRAAEWRGARVVESGGLENRYSSNAIEGSNPSLSAAVGRVLKLADRRVSEARVRKDVWVQVPPRPQAYGDTVSAGQILTFGDLSVAVCVFGVSHDTFIFLGLYGRRCPVPVCCSKPFCFRPNV